MNIEIISASAGSGKTTELARRLASAITSREVDPEAILVTTFTKKAAAEIRERVRTLLLAEHPDSAQRLFGARIGTVNAVCGQLACDYAEELGISPAVRVVDEAQANEALLRAQSQVITPHQERRLAALTARMGGFDWAQAVANIVSLARANGMDAEKVRGCAERSKEGFATLLGTSAAGDQADTFDRQLLEALVAFPERVADGDQTKDTTAALARVRSNADQMEQQGWIPWKEWVYLANLQTGAKSRQAAEAVKTAAAAFDSHPSLNAQALEAIDLVFGVAADALREYERYKQQLGVVDFTDQEILALRLLRKPEIQAILADELKLVLVDEFQDTSPLQLCIFAELAALAERCVWVGDQKQAIYAFRGTDPSLMDAAITAALDEEGPQVLANSWRTRPELVRLTSKLFAAAFAGHGLDKKRVELEPGRPAPQVDLGHHLEYWELMAPNNQMEAEALAAGVQEMLADPTVLVEDRATGECRRPEPRDVAVLCRTNDACRAVARALERAGVPSAAAQTGLLETPEARLALAALRLWVDCGDRLAEAEIVRLVDYPDGPDTWLADVIDRAEESADNADGAGPPPDEAGTDGGKAVKGLRQAAAEWGLAGAVESLDAAITALGLPLICARWGSVSWRLANLDALRVIAVRYAGECGNTGAGCTPAGLVAHLVRLREGAKELCAVSPQEQAVAVSTWHGAKGLEWPIAVVGELAGASLGSALGVTVVPGEAGFDFADPLAGRWIRYWPMPFDAKQRHYPFYDRLEEAPETARAKESSLRENLRVLYMCWTRARDRLVLAYRSGKLLDGRLSLLKDPEGQTLLAMPADGTCRLSCGGQELEVLVRRVEAQETEVTRTIDTAWYDVPGPTAYAAAFVQPSRVQQHGQAGAQLHIGPRLQLLGNPDMQTVGEAIHAFLAADDPDTLQRDERLASAGYLLDRWGASGALTPEDLLQASDALHAWLQKLAPDGVRHREYPVLRRLETGSVLRGEADLVLEAVDGFYLVDHKSFPGGAEQALERAGEVAGQVLTYAEAVALATGKKALGCFVHLPISGIVVPVEVGR